MEKYTIQYNVIFSSQVEILASSMEEAVEKIRKESEEHGVTYHNFLSVEVADCDVIAVDGVDGIDEIFA